MISKDCPCFSGKKYLDCCGRFIDDNALPDMPEELMRSRYTAYASGNINYIVATMKGPAANNFNAEEALAWARKVNWLGLKLIRSKQEGDRAYVEFIASFAYQEQKQQLHELSEFMLENGKWFYVDGKVIT